MNYTGPRFRACVAGQTIGWYDTAQEAEEAINTYLYAQLTEEEEEEDQ